MSGKETDSSLPAGRAWRKLLSLPVLAATTALTAAIGWAVPYYLSKSAEPPEGKPVSVVVEDNPAEIDAFNDETLQAVIPRDSQIIGDPGVGCSGFHGWARSQNGADGERSYMRLLIQGRSSKAVVLSSMRATILTQKPPLVGTTVRCPSAGEVQTRAIAIDLDGRSPIARRADGSDEFAFTIADGETEVFDLTAIATRSYVTWELELRFTVDGEPYTVTVKATDGKPFRTTAVGGTKSYDWDYEDTWYIEGGDTGGASVPAGSGLPHL